MIDLGLLTLLRPLWLLTLPALLLALWWMVRGRGGLGRWRRVIDGALAPALERLGHIVPGKGWGAAAPLAATGAVLALALSGPAIRDDEAPAFRNVDVIMMLIDLSDSVTKGGGLDDAQAAAARILAEAGGRPVALALYAGESYLISGPTEEPMTLQSIIAVLNEAVMPVRGGRPDRALALARQTLADASAQGADVVLISDGGGIGPEALDAAERLRKDLGARVSALYVAPTNAEYGAPPPDRDALERLAAAGGGQVADAVRPSPLLRRLEGGGASARDAGLATLIYEDHGRWLLLLALPPALLLFRRRSRG